MSLSLTSAAPAAPALLFVALSSTPTPFKGGTLLPLPPLATQAFATDGSGALQLPVASWPSGASGASVVLQFAVKDAAAVHGVALSNGERASVP